MDERRATRLHATAIALAVDADGPLAGILFLGPSGSGKSSLALVAIEGCPFQRTALVADDQVLISEDGAASAPRPLKGLIEARGFGPARVRAVDRARLIAAFDLGIEAERTPLSQWSDIAPGVSLRRYPFLWTGAEAAAAHRLRVAVRAILGGQTGEEPQDASIGRG